MTASRRHTNRHVFVALAVAIAAAGCLGAEPFEEFVETEGALVPNQILGASTVYTPGFSFPAGAAHAYAYKASANGTAQKIVFYLGSGSTTTDLRLGLYSDNNGNPGTLRASARVTAPQVGWNTASLSPNTFAISHGTTYWLAVHSTSGVVVPSREQGFGILPRRRHSNQSLNGLPATWSTDTSSSNIERASFYVLGEPPAPALKPACTGLMVRDADASLKNNTSRWPSIPAIDDVVVLVKWSNLETSDGVWGNDWNRIDAVIADPAIRGVRVRILAGTSSPEWLKEGNGRPAGRFPAVREPGDRNDSQGDPVPAQSCDPDGDGFGGIAIWSDNDNVGGCTTRFWDAWVIEQYAQLIREFARRYESNNKVREVTQSGCMTTYAEPFYVGHFDIPTNKRLYAAGLNFLEHDRCLRATTEIHDLELTTTRTSLSVSKWERFGSDGVMSRNFEDARDFANWARSFMGNKLVLQNNGMGEVDGEICTTTPTPSTAPNEFCYIKVVTGPKGFQTESSEQLQSPGYGANGEFSLWAALKNSYENRATFVELPAGYASAPWAKMKTGTTYPDSLAEWDALFEAP